MKLNAIIVALMGFVGASAAFAAEFAAEFSTVTNATAATSGVKLCSVFVPDTWRDTMQVPQEWQAETCKSVVPHLGATAYQLGCMFKDGVSFGPVNSGTPLPNCDWK